MSFLANNVSKVLVDTGIFNWDLIFKDLSEDKYNWRSFSRYIYEIKETSDLSLERLNTQLNHTILIHHFVRNNENIRVTNSIRREYAKLIKHQSHLETFLRRKNNKGLKKDERKLVETYFGICEMHRRIYDLLDDKTLSFLNLDPSFVEVRIMDYMKERNLHRPRGKLFVKNNGSNGICDSDLELAARAYGFALSQGNGVVVFTTDMDIINLIYNFGQDYMAARRNGENLLDLKQRVSVYFPSYYGWQNELKCKFKANSEGKNYNSLVGPWY